MPPLHGLPLFACGCLMAACGATASATGSTCTPAPTVSAAPPQASAGSLTVSADRGVVLGGATIHLVAHVAGPARLQTDCAAPAQLVVLDSADVHVAADSPPGERGMPCGSVTLTASASLDYALAWTPDPTLPPGPYTAVVTVGDLPGVALTLRLAPPPGASC